MILGRLVVRLVLGGGVRGAIRLLLMTFGVAAMVAAMGAALSYPTIVDARAERAAQRIAVRAVDGGPKPFLYLEVDDFIRDRRWMRVMVEASADAPLPPGVNRYPARGETVASPALTAAARSSPQLARRLGRIVGEIGPEGLQGPDEYVSYSGLPSELRTDAPAGARYGAAVADVPDKPPAEVLTSEVLVLVSGPAMIFLVVSSRLSDATRARRLAALRLVGLSRRQLVTIARAEASLAAAVGGGLGLAAFALAMPRLGTSAILGIGWYPQDTRVGPVRAFAVLCLIVAVAAAVAGQGLRPVLADAARVRRGEEPRSDGGLRFLPLLTGTTVLLVFAVLTRNHATRTYGPETVYTVLAGIVLAVAGLLWALPVLVRRLADVVARRAKGLGVLLAARRVQYETSSVVRTVSGLVLLVVVAAMGQAVLRSVALAAGSQRLSQSVQVSLVKVPVQERERLLQIASNASVLTVLGELVRPGQAPSATPDPTNLVGVHFVDCAHLRMLTRQPLAACRNGATYRLQDADAKVARNRLTPGETVGWGSASSAPGTLQVPTDELVVSGLLGMGVITTDSVLKTSVVPPSGIPDQATLDLVVGPGSEAMEALQADIAVTAPSAQVRLDRDVFGIEMYRIHRGAVILALVVALGLATLSFLVTTIDRAIERRPAVASLVVLGAPVRLLRRVQLSQVAMTLGTGLVMALGIGHLASYGYLVVADPQIGPSWDPTVAAALMAAVVTLAALAAAWAVPGRRPRPEDLRRE